VEVRYVQVLIPGNDLKYFPLTVGLRL